MKKNALVLMVLACFWSAGCANIKVSEPVPTEYIKAQSYNADYDVIWGATVDWFANSNVIIDKIEKTSGLLTAKYRLSLADTYLDCGEVKASGVLGGDSLERRASLNVTVREQAEGVLVNVNIFGEFIYTGRDAWDGHLVTKNGQCVSTGNLEKLVFQHIEARIRK